MILSPLPLLIFVFSSFSHYCLLLHFFSLFSLFTFPPLLLSISSLYFLTSYILHSHMTLSYPMSSLYFFIPFCNLTFWFCFFIAPFTCLLYYLFTDSILFLSIIFLCFLYPLVLYLFSQLLLSTFPPFSSIYLLSLCAFLLLSVSLLFSYYSLSVLYIIPLTLLTFPLGRRTPFSFSTVHYFFLGKDNFFVPSLHLHTLPSFILYISFYSVLSYIFSL